MERLKNKVAVVTGGARGIGKATAELFCREGASVIIWDLLEEGEETAAAIRSQGFICEFQKISTTDVEGIEKAVAGIIQKYEKIDILVNNAGITRDKTLLKMEQNEWQQVIDVNLTGVFNCTKAVAPFMVERQYGRILCASSINGVHGAFGQTNYAATKAGLIAMCRTWAKELGKYNITANAVAPGFIITDMTDAIPDDLKKGAIAQIPARRAGQPIDIANAYLFLASEEASFISGQVLGVNGGIAS
ncbi:MAG: beta-ketoacyl-ACP reductase [Spirosomaceae bacterium]|nr:beta-ketoacyl-ACP reductase [Spirosomataceae bacterium]